MTLKDLKDRTDMDMLGRATRALHLELPEAVANDYVPRVNTAINEIKALRETVLHAEAEIAILRDALRRIGQAEQGNVVDTTGAQWDIVEWADFAVLCSHARYEAAS
jgi:hypothetical protein